MSDIESPDRGALATRLDGLERSGAERFDPVGVEFVVDLLDRSGRLGGRARERIEARAAEHLTRLEDAHRGACVRARAALEALSPDTLGQAEVDALRDAIDAGDPLPALRTARRLSASPPANSLPKREASHRRYRDALADLQTALASRAERSADPQTGLLNGTRLAARILEEAEAISPAWRRSLVASLFDLAALMHLPETPAPRRHR